MAALLSDTVVDELLSEMVGWAREGNSIRKTYQWISFPAAMAFVTHVAFLAEAAGHHPDIDIRYNKVTLALSTHDAGGLTQQDFDLAAQADEIMG